MTRITAGDALSKPGVPSPPARRARPSGRFLPTRWQKSQVRVQDLHVMACQATPRTKRTNTPWHRDSARAYTFPRARGKAGMGVAPAWRCHPGRRASAKLEHWRGGVSQDFAGDFKGWVSQVRVPCVCQQVACCCVGKFGSLGVQSGVQ